MLVKNTELTVEVKHFNSINRMMDKIQRAKRLQTFAYSINLLG